ncbi:MAG: hypothetical protein N4A61_03675 [Pelagimonas sp.]|jgi:ABC-type nickel/cobalt efflux system permease component RcnA|nr:hypothetical protein [Pelagimonas sp.]
MRLILLSLVLIALVGVAFFLVDTQGIASWAAEQQRGFQHQMAQAVRGLRSGDAGAWLVLMGAAGAYGFMHAVGPGHGKAVIGGVGVASSISAWRLLSLSLISSLAQALWAIIIVYGGFAVLSLSARTMTTLAEDYLAPASYLAISAIGLVLIWRGVRALVHQMRNDGHDRAHAHDHHHDHSHDHHHVECGCHAHGPSPDAVARVTSLRDAIILVASIAIRPCTGAIFLLVIAWQMDIRAAGAAAVVVMGLGTASLTSLVALSSVAARGVAIASFKRAGLMRFVLSGLQITTGALIVWISLLMLRIAGL